MPHTPQIHHLSVGDGGYVVVENGEGVFFWETTYKNIFLMFIKLNMLIEMVVFFDN